MLIATSLNIGVGRCSEASLMPLLAETGFQGVDFNFCDHLDREDWTRPDAGNAWTDGMARAADEAGLKWVQAHGPMFSPEADAQTERGVMLCKTSIRLCGRLGVPWMVLHPNPTAQIHDPARPGPAVENIAAFFRKLLPDCEKANVGIAIENVSDGRAKDAPPSKPLRFGSVAEELCQMIDLLNHPLIGACWDTGHARLMSHDQKTSLTLLGPRLKALHIQENNGVKDAHVLPFGYGSDCVDWPGVMRGLRDIRYPGAFTYETHAAFHPLPEALFRPTLRHSVAIAKYLIEQGADDERRPS